MSVPEDHLPKTLLLPRLESLPFLLGCYTLGFTIIPYTHLDHRLYFLLVHPIRCLLGSFMQIINVSPAMLQGR